MRPALAQFRAVVSQPCAIAPIKNPVDALEILVMLVLAEHPSEISSEQEPFVFWNLLHSIVATMGIDAADDITFARSEHSGVEKPVWKDSKTTHGFLTDEQSLPPGYFTSSYFVGSYFASGMALMAGLGGFSLLLQC